MSDNSALLQGNCGSLMEKVVGIAAVYLNFKRYIKELTKQSELS